MTIIEQAQAELAAANDPRAGDLCIVPRDTIAALCRALIDRHDALRGIERKAGRIVDFWNAEHEPSVPHPLTKQIEAARRALADEPHTGQGD